MRLACRWMLVQVPTDSGPGLSVPKPPGKQSRPIRLSLEYLSESFSLDQGNIRAGLNICSLLLSRVTCSARVTGHPEVNERTLQLLVCRPLVQNGRFAADRDFTDSRF